eukprot:TRINITY_DN4144_c0_g3_i1.p1 TRINITY_DN4144_c0_g3~~TRINITY_DN4144_c0_g3_i1.p1  ORF type:complete len:683 (+),score=143.53 TRINITY_DN4144_c0_g3_i1:46-2094(+)
MQLNNGVVTLLVLFSFVLKILFGIPTLYFLGSIFISAIIYEKWSRSVSDKHSTKNYTLHDLINKAPKTNKKIAIVGSGISGIQAMKTCLEYGMEPVCFEADSDYCGFWRYKEDSEHPSVYKSVHIDSERDLNCFADFPHPPSAPLLLHNTEVVKYLRDNVKEFKLEKYINYNTKVDFITPSKKDEEGNYTWTVTVTTTDPKTAQKTSKSMEFNGVLVCTGRHGGGAYEPDFPGLKDFKGLKMHSSQYKYPEKHGIPGKTVVVVGNGNSGLDIVTETSQYAKSTYLVSRSGLWLFKTPHGNDYYASMVADRILSSQSERLPWWISADLAEWTRSFRNGELLDQDIIDKHGMKPTHRVKQQHLLVTGLHDPVHTLHNQLETGKVIVKKGIQRFTSDGVLFDGDSEPTKVDIVVLATGYRQAVNFVDTKVINLRFDRPGNDVLMYKSMLPITEYNGLAFINFVQSATFMCAELQSRLYCLSLLGKVKLPSLEEQKKEALAVRNTLCAQYMDRQQLRVQAGISVAFYDDLAETIGCYPSITKLLTERPTAIWHAWFTEWQSLHYRLVGPGRLETTEKHIEDFYDSRHYGKFRNLEHTGMKPLNRGSALGLLKAFGTYVGLFTLIAYAKLRGYKCGSKIQDHLEENLEYAKTDKIPHSLQIDSEPDDVSSLGGKKIATFQGLHSKST